MEGNLDAHLQELKLHPSSGLWFSQSATEPHPRQMRPMRYSVSFCELDVGESNIFLLMHFVTLETMTSFSGCPTTGDESLACLRRASIGEFCRLQGN